MTQMYLDGKPVAFIPDEALFFVIHLGPGQNPTHFYREEVAAAAQARCLTGRLGGEFVVGQIRSFHQKQIEVFSTALFGNQTWPTRYKPGAYAALMAAAA